ncbi:hypothetical protein SD70_08325 [Gordoniibacillus kamchatkensis]|uniref:Cthe-2314-like HEPN domain-containing protein n=1 Tax=Gordoniibacillus kamchatkensis TaxID=1590651 RepID=A0ABR5AJM4_9BACL|nr:Cthe_2314 family HEPN domain-containing protein [Paenibacillus sp. VKM B-2647]KIL41250.1 hypothetical protein SD70_08325 [Paenibacillus sp. VKM B-2647]
MLRALFGEPKRKDEGELLFVFRELDRFAAALAAGKVRGGLSAEKVPQYAIWTHGLRDAMDELEQSCYCAAKFAANIRSPFVEQMDEREKDDYRRYVYFYKNALIRVFSLLDKLGYFLNESFALETERVKERFSYFTVLRRMRDRQAHPQLQQRLYELKTEYKMPLASLRKQRNMEIHYVNSELLDDLKQTSYRPGDRLRVEDVRAQTGELEQAYRMVADTLLAVFTYMNEKAGERR